MGSHDVDAVAVQGACSMTATLFDIESPSFSVVPRCIHCGASGPEIVGRTVSDPWRGATELALLAISEHVREIHPDLAPRDVEGVASS